LASNKFDKEQIEKALELYQVLKDLRRENGYLTKEFQAQLDAVTKYLEEYEKVTNEVEKVTKKIKEQNNFLDDTEVDTTIKKPSRRAAACPSGERNN
jgi:Asp-tRNA(Asn)/Glu-tRNA(Gln) amidotransferase C subunit